MTISDQSGFSQTATTSTFGFYMFENIPSGRSYTFSVASRRYRFLPVTRFLDGNLTDLDLVGFE